MPVFLWRIRAIDGESASSDALRKCPRAGVPGATRKGLDASDVRERGALSVRFFC
jgi:hypothetical protein